LDDTRYEIIDGDLYVANSRVGTISACAGGSFLFWSSGLSRLGWVNQPRPGPHLCSRGERRTRHRLDQFALAWTGDWTRPAICTSRPSWVVEVLSPELANEQRDRETKLKLTPGRV